MKNDIGLILKVYIYVNIVEKIRSDPPPPAHSNIQLFLDGNLVEEFHRHQDEDNLINVWFIVKSVIFYCGRQKPDIMAKLDRLVRNERFLYVKLLYGVTFCRLVYLNHLKLDNEGTVYRLIGNDQILSFYFSHHCLKKVDFRPEKEFFYRTVKKQQQS